VMHSLYLALPVCSISNVRMMRCVSFSLTPVNILVPARNVVIHTGDLTQCAPNFRPWLGNSESTSVGLETSCKCLVTSNASDQSERVLETIRQVPLSCIDDPADVTRKWLPIIISNIPRTWKRLFLDNLREHAARKNPPPAVGPRSTCALPRTSNRHQQGAKSSASSLSVLARSTLGIKKERLGIIPFV